HPENTLEVSKEHLDLLPAMARLRVFRRGGNRSCDVPGILVEITRHLAHRHFRAAALLELAYIAVAFPCPVKPRAFGGNARSRRFVSPVELLQFLAGRADVAIALRLPCEVRARESAVGPIRLVEDGDVWRDLLF